MRKQVIRFLWLYWLVAGVAAAQAQPVIIGYSNCVAAANYSQSVMDRIGQSKWYFAHASVGECIMEGVTNLHLTNPSLYQLQGNASGSTPPGTTQGGVIYEDARGNPNYFGDYQLKLDLFRTAEGNGWHYPAVNIALFKFCFIDIWYATTSNTVAALLDSYVNTLTNLEAAYPQTMFVYATMPLTTTSYSYSTLDTGAATLYWRNVFNDSLRAWCVAHSRVLLDIADIESHDTDGNPCTFTYNGRLCQQLWSGYNVGGQYSGDQSHPGNLGAEELLAQGLYAVAGSTLSRWSSLPPVGPLTLVSPLGNVAAGSIQRYTFQADTNAVQYELYVTHNGGLFCDRWFTLSNSVADSTTGNFAVDVSGHTAGSYQWYVRGWNTAGLGPWSSAGGFTMESASPGLVTLIAPANNITLQARRPQLAWTQSSPAAEWYDLYLTRNGSKYLDQWMQGATNWTSAADLPPGSYSWSVRPWSAAGYGLWSATFTFSIQAAVPGAITLVSPAGSAAAGSAQRYTWQADAAASWYELYVLQNGKMLCDKWFTLSNSVAQDGSGSFAVDVSGHTAGSYQWYVRGWGTDGLGPWSSMGSFTIASPPAPGPVTLLAPINNPNVLLRQPEFTWTASSPAATWYYLYVTRGGSKYLEQWVEGTNHWVATSSLPAGSYTWYIHPWNATGYGPWSASGSFTIQAAVPGVITPSFPSGSVAAGATQRYTWQADAAATWYELYMLRNGAPFGDHWYALSNSVVGSATGNFAVDVPGHSSGTYQWWVRGWGPDGFGPWNSGLSFQTP